VIDNSETAFTENELCSGYWATNAYGYARWLQKTTHVT